MKLAVSLFAAAWLFAGCVSGSSNPHADSPAATNRAAGPALCRDGTTPPCNSRD